MGKNRRKVFPKVKQTKKKRNTAQLHSEMCKEKEVAARSDEFPDQTSDRAKGDCAGAPAAALQVRIAKPNRTQIRQLC